MYEAKQNKEKVSRTISEHNMKRKRANDLTPFLSIAFPIQRAAFIGSTMLLPHNTISKYGTGDDLSDIKFADSNSTKLMEIAMNDDFKRFYLNEQEFHDHFSGQPVPCGLIRKLNLWYRLPFGNQFFVLGERHNILNYHSILEESNQHGKVLVEGGTIPIGTSIPTLTEEEESISYMSVESALAKTLFALIVMQQSDNEQANAIRQDNTLIQDDNPIDRRTFNNKRFSDIHYKKYNQYEMARDIIQYCIKEIDKYRYYVRDNIVKYDMHTFAIELYKLKTLLNNLLQLIENQKYLKKDFEDAILLCESCVEKEMLSKKLNKARPKYDTLSKKEKKIEPQNRYDANSNREAYMLNAIINADKSKYLMAGFGDNHVKHMKPELENKHIKVITFDDFKSQYSQVSKL